MASFLGWFGLACLGASLALAVLAWRYRCRCTACEAVRWRLTRPALDGAPILHLTSETAAQDIRFVPYGRGPIEVPAHFENDSDGRTVFVPAKRCEWKPKSTSVWRGDE